MRIAFIDTVHPVLAERLTAAGHEVELLHWTADDALAQRFGDGGPVRGNPHDNPNSNEQTVEISLEIEDGDTGSIDFETVALSSDGCARAVVGNLFRGDQHLHRP